MMKNTNTFLFLTVLVFGSLLATPQGDLEQAVKNNNVAEASRIIKAQRPGKDKKQWFEFIFPSFCLAAEMGHVEILKQCLPLNAELPLNQNYNHAIMQPLAQALCRGDRPEIFGVLKQKSETLLHSLLQWAAVNGELAYAMFLVERGISMRGQRRSFAFDAAEHGHVGILRYFFEKNPHLPKQNYGSHTLLHAAARSGRLSVVKFLLEECARFLPDHKNYHGKTPLHLAAARGATEVVQYLLTRGAQADIKDKKETTALDVASNKAIRKLLTDHLKASANQEEQNIANNPAQEAGPALGGLAALAEAAGQLGEVQEQVQSNNAEAVHAPAAMRPSVNIPLNQAVQPAHVDHAALIAPMAGPAEHHNELMPDFLPEDIGLSFDDPEYQKSSDVKNFLPDALEDKGEFCLPELGLGGISQRPRASSSIAPAEHNAPEAHSLADELIPAAQNGDFDTVQRVLTQGADVNCQTALQATPLIIASSAGHLRIVRLLLDRGPNINAEDLSKKTALERALENGHLDIARLLIDRGAKIDREPDAESPLYIAAQKGNLEAVKLLVRHRAKTMMNFGEYSPLNAAVLSGNLDMVQCLVEAGVPLLGDPRYKSPVFVAAEKEHVRIAKYLVAQQSELAYQRFSQHFTPLHVAAMRGFASLVSYLCTCAGVEVDCKDLHGNTPLHLAVTYGHVAVVRALLEAGADDTIQTRRGETAKMLARNRGYNEIVNLLVGFAKKRAADAQQHKSKVEQALLRAAAQEREEINVARSEHKKRNADDSDSERPRKKAKGAEASQPSAAESSLEEEFIAACKNKDLEKIERCITRDQSLLRIKDDRGASLMHMLAYGRHNEAFEYILQNYGDDQLSEQTVDGATVLHHAAMGGDVAIVNVLLSRGLSITCKTNNGMTPLMCAVQLGHEGVVSSMLQRNDRAEKTVAVNEPTYGGRLPLLIAAQKGYDKIVALLLAHGAIADAYDRKGQIALFVAVKAALQENVPANYVSVIRSLLAHGAQPDQNIAGGQTVAEYVQQHESDNQEIRQLFSCDA